MIVSIRPGGIMAQPDDVVAERISTVDGTGRKVREPRPNRHTVVCAKKGPAEMSNGRPTFET
jgi:hypothetical protein